jgi:hypothetical protein
VARSLLVKTTVVAAISLTFFLTGWWLGSQAGNRTETADPRAAVGADERVARLEQELSILQRQVAEQRQIIRDHALTPSNRSLDEMLALFPAKFPKGNWAPGNTAFEDCWIEAVDGIRLHGWYFRHEDSTAIILYVHGNAGNVTHRAGLATSLRERLKASVLVFDYRGYGRSEGVPTMEGIVRDARAARDYLAMREEVSPAKIVLMGRSLGGAVAVQLAGEDGARGLVLESTFSSLRKIAVSHYPEILVNLLVADRLDSASAIRNYHGPLLQSHGDADHTIPFALGRELFDAANEPKTFIRIPRGEHNDAQTEEYYQELERFIRALPP